MVTIWDRRAVLRLGRQDLPERIDVDVPTLGDALLEAERVFGRPIKPAAMHDKYFFVGSQEGPSDSRPDVAAKGWARRWLASLLRPRSVPRCHSGLGNTDIHIERDGATLCPKQDLSFALLSGDVVVFDALIC